ELTLQQFRAAAIPVAFLAALQALLWRRAMQANPADAELQTLQNLALQLVSGGCLGVTLTGLTAELNLVQILMVCGTFVALAADSLVTALGMRTFRRLSQEHAG